MKMKIPLLGVSPIMMKLEGDEFKDAQNSPVKGKCRVDSKVGLYINSY
jgi:hypothetical protein